MKFACSCGAVIRDQTDYLSNKAHVIADQDWYDALDLSDAGSRGWTGFAQLIYECVQCGRLWFDKRGEGLLAFTPEGHAGGILGSVKEDRWKAPLRASWHDTPTLVGAARGAMYIARGRATHLTTYDSWEELEAAYHRELEERRSEGTLRDALLQKNGVAVHSWPEPLGIDEE